MDVFPSDEDDAIPRPRRHRGVKRIDSDEEDEIIADKVPSKKPNLKVTIPSSTTSSQGKSQSQDKSQGNSQRQAKEENGEDELEVVGEEDDDNESQRDLFPSPAPSLSDDHDSVTESEGEGIDLDHTDEEDDAEDDIANSEDEKFVDDDDVEDLDDGVRPLLPDEKLGQGELTIPDDTPEATLELFNYLVQHDDRIQRWRRKKEVRQNGKPQTEENYHAVLLGPGGSGKTYTIMSLVNLLVANKIPCMVTGMTGGAANVFNTQLLDQANRDENIIPCIEKVRDYRAKTLHSALGLSLLVHANIELAKCQQAVKDAEKLNPRDRENAATKLRRAQAEVAKAENSILASKATKHLREKVFGGKGVIIIDEASMLDTRLLHFLNRLVTKLRWMGGSPTLLLVGDFYQLPPVNGTPVFEDDLMKAMFGTRVVSLEKIHRSSGDDDLTKHCLRIREGELPKDTKDFLLSRDVTDTSQLPKNVVVIAAKNDLCRRINTSQHEELREQGHKEEQLDPRPVITPKTHPESPVLAVLRRRATARAMSHLKDFQKVLLCVGERVRVCANIDPKKGITLGMMGVVTGFKYNQDGRGVKGVNVLFDGQDRAKTVAAFKHEETETEEKYKVTVRVDYIPLLPGRAVTVDAIQGQTISDASVAVWCVETNADTGLDQQVLFGDVIRRLYVAIGRVCQTDQLYLVNASKLDLENIFSPYNVQKSFGALKEWENWVRETKAQFDGRNLHLEKLEDERLQKERDAAQYKLRQMRAAETRKRKLPQFMSRPTMQSMFQLLQEKGWICPSPCVHPEEN